MRPGGLGDAVFAGVREDVLEVCGIAERRFCGQANGESSQAVENPISNFLSREMRLAHGIVKCYTMRIYLWDGSGINLIKQEECKNDRSA